MNNICSWVVLIMTLVNIVALIVQSKLINASIKLIKENNNE